MAPKAKKGGGKKDKGPSLVASEEAAAPFGLRVGEIVRTPLGLLGTVLGVKYEDPEAKDSGRLWVRYNNGHEAPLEPRAGAGSINQLGYLKCAEAAHIRRDISAQDAEHAKAEEQRRVIDEVLRLTEQGLPIPAHLLPPPKEEKPKKEVGGKKKK